MTKDKKWYAVWKGRKRGVFDTWDQCLAQVSGYPGAQYLSFSSPEMARLALEQTYEKVRRQVACGQTMQIGHRGLAAKHGAPILEAIAVDASCPGNPGPVEFRGVDIGAGKEIFRQGPLRNGTNNIGEFLAIVHALAYLTQRKKRWPVYSDSEIALTWVRKKQCRTQLVADGSNADVFIRIRRAEEWLKANKFPNQILKWETGDWGENPADFQRK